MEFINQLDHRLSSALNCFHTEWLDWFMLLVSHKYTFIPLYIFLVAVLIMRFKKQSWLVFVAIIIIISVTDQFTSGFMKPYFQRLRPCHDATLSKNNILVGNCGGEFGMASSHAANTIAIACFLILLLARDKKWIWLLMPWAILVSYSRVYLGVHFLGDVLAGFLVGIFVQFCAFWAIKHFKLVD
ncbi:MAG: phosphatase PAP2 family protein [Cytophagales bacterium]